MTLLEEKAAAAPPAAAPAPKKSVKPKQKVARKPNGALHGIGITLCLIAVLVLGFVVYLFGLSRIQEQRVQNTMYKTLRDEMARGVAPTAPTKNGKPVAVLNIPRLGLDKSVVIEGTRPADLMNGPGHRTDTPLPGQPGVSVVDGRHGTFGAPFGHLTRLQQGDPITVITGYGTAKYQVAAIGDDRNPPQLTAANRLMLVTTNSSNIPTRSVIVGAVMVGNPLPAGTLSYASEPASNEKNLAIDTKALQPLMLWSLALALVSAIGTIAAARWARWPAYLACSPVLLAIAWNIYENAAQLLPNLY